VTTETNDKIKNLEVILRARLGGRGSSSPSVPALPKNKVMLFIAFESDGSLDRWLSPLLNSLGIQWRFLKGNHNTTAAIEREYRHGDIDLLLVNTKNYGSGLNCENTTDVILMHKFDSDIEHQVVGRAQRMGRTAPLNVWYMVFDNEMTATGGV
jgi:hypothetical protein